MHAEANRVMRPPAKLMLNLVTDHQLDLPVDLEACVRLEIILLNEAQANNWHYLFNRMRHATRGLTDHSKGGICTPRLIG